AQVILQAGERIVGVTCGGGGYGPPTDRDPTAVAEDVAEGWVSRERAEQVYGVILDADGAVDPAATTSRREGLQHA
ncbi:MAG: Hydantoinase B/oxoprolinase, partial [Caulobacteraceae bacterium]|nr:Hydantoinase B/oxoprolinase [Caulobacteraceae bacterium]